MSIASSPQTQPLSGPCAPARADVDTRCADAERLAQAAVAHQQRLRDVRRQLMEVVTLRENDSRVRDRRQLSVSKDEARAAYNMRLIQAKGPTDVREAARAWLHEIDRLNRQVTLADQRADDVQRRANELENAMPGVELAADAARIAAESAQAACIDARRALAACEEEAQRRIRATSTAAEPFVPASTAASAAPPIAQAASRTTSSVSAIAPGGMQRRMVRPISLVLRGDRQTLLTLALGMAEETGVEAGRLQLLLLELREQLAARALEVHVLRFPEGHPFWSQFPGGGARQVVQGLASMGYRFDGHSGWLDGHAPTIRELAIALSHVGYDPRGLRRPASQEAIDQLWQGTSVAVEEYLARQAPDLDLEHVIACLGPRAAGLSELWDMWGRLRTLLLTPA